MAADDAAASEMHDVRKEVWAGRIPAVVTLAPEELTTVERPQPLFLMLPRQSYLPHATRRVREHFVPYAPPCSDEIWLEFNGTPLKWCSQAAEHIPTGVLFDTLVGARDALQHQPWSLVVHFHNFPSESVLRGGGTAELSAVGAHFLNTLKEATYLHAGSAKAVMALSTSAQQQLMRAVQHGAYADYRGAMAHLEPSARAVEEGARGGAAGTSPARGGRRRRLPVRIFVGGRPWVQPVIESTDGTSGEARTLGAVLRETLPDLFSEAPPAAATAAEACDSTARADGPSAAVPGPHVSEVLVQGVPAPIDAPIDWLASASSHPDGFLYVIIRLRG